MTHSLQSAGRPPSAVHLARVDREPRAGRRGLFEKIILFFRTMCYVALCWFFSVSHSSPVHGLVR